MTLEAYYVTSCSQFPAGPFTASGLTLLDVNHMSPTLKWSPFLGGQCGSMLTSNDNNTAVTIQENTSAAAPR